VIIDKYENNLMLKSESKKDFSDTKLNIVYYLITCLAIFLNKLNTYVFLNIEF